MKEITSIKTGKIQVIPDEVWNDIVGRGWEKKFTVINMQERKLREVPIINKPVELTKPKKVLKNG